MADIETKRAQRSRFLDRLAAIETRLNRLGNTAQDPAGLQFTLDAHRDELRAIEVRLASADRETRNGIRAAIIGADSALQNYLNQNLQQTLPLLESRLNGIVRRADLRVE